MGTVLIGYFWGELVPLGNNDRGGAGTKSLIVGTVWIGYFEGQLVPLGTNEKGVPVPNPYCGQRLDRVF